MLFMALISSQLKALVLGVIFAIFVGELSLRLVSNKLLSTSNFLEEEYNSQNRHTPHIDHSQLGWAAPRNLRTSVSFLTKSSLGTFDRKTIMTFDSSGFRKHWAFMCPEKSLQISPIVTLGDSFTLGSETNDEETWPAHLQMLNRRTVLNAGFARYGLDQMLILLKDLLTRIQPETIIVSLTPANIRRVSETKKISHFYLERSEKPYFLIDNSSKTLRLENTPIAGKSISQQLKGIRSVLGHSLLAHYIFRSVSFNFWYGVPQRNDLYPDGISKSETTDLAWLILKEFRNLSMKYNFKLLVLIQDEYQPPFSGAKYNSIPILDSMREGALGLGIQVLDLRESLSSLFISDPSVYESFFFPFGHMTNQGNLFVAAELSKIIKAHSKGCL
jgi:hypothetical protein